jgi:hypothetical protein
MDDGHEFHFCLTPRTDKYVNLEGSFLDAPQNALLCHETDAFTRMARLRQSCRGMRPLPDSIYTSAPDGSAGHSRKSCANAEKDVLSRRCLLWEKDSACAYPLTPFWQRTLVQSSLWGDGYFRYVTPLLAGKCFLRMRGC